MQFPASGLVSQRRQDVRNNKPTAAFHSRRLKVTRRLSRVPAMSLIIVIIVLVLLFGGGGGYYAHRSYGLPGLGGVLGLIVFVLIIAWLLGGLRI